MLDPTHRVTVFGGTGFLGRNLVDRLLRQGYRVRVAVRNPRPDLFQDTDNRLEQVRSDVRDVQSVADSIEGADGVVNAVGLYVESRNWCTYRVSVPIQGHPRLISVPEPSVNSGCARQRRKQLFCGRSYCLGAAMRFFVACLVWYAGCR